MVIGKTSSSVSKAELFTRFSEVDVLTKVFHSITSLPCKISSPFRVDNNPSFSIYMGDNNHIYYKDFGDSNEHGGLLDLLCKYWKCTFNQCLDKIYSLMSEGSQDSSLTLRPKQLKVLTRKETQEATKLQIVKRPWHQYDREYWSSYGIELKWLRYVEVFPISYKIITKKDPETSKTKTYIFSADKYAYCFVERKEGKVSLKIYQPFNTKGYKWCSKMDSSVIGLWNKIPKTGDRVVICSSLKDALCLRCQCNIPTLCLQGEGYNMSQTAVKELKKRYKKVFICFDTDAPGLADAEKLSQQTGFPFIVPDLHGEKDLSDYYKSLQNKEEFKQIELLFN